MIQNILTFCVKNDLTFVDGSLPSGKLVANDLNRNSIYLITPYIDAVVMASFQSNLQSDTPISTFGTYVGDKVDVKDIVDEDATYFNLVKDWAIWEFKVPSKTLSFISRNRASNIGISFSIEQRILPNIKPSYGAFTEEITSPTQVLTLSAGYYIVKVAEYIHEKGLSSEKVLHYNDIAIGNPRIPPGVGMGLFVVPAIVFKGMTATISYSVDPSILNDNFEYVEPTLTQVIMASLGGLRQDVKSNGIIIGQHTLELTDHDNRIYNLEVFNDTLKLNDFNDVNITSPLNKQVLVFNSVMGYWENVDTVEKALKDDLGNTIKSTYANKLDLAYSSSNNRIAITLKSYDGTTIDADLIDLPKATTITDGLMAKEDKAYVNGLPSALSLKENKSEKGVANGYASLDGGAKIPTSQLPDSILGQLEYKGTFNPSGGYPVSPEKGWFYIAIANALISGVDYKVGDWAVYNGVSWDKVDNTDAVASVNGKLGAVILYGNEIQVGNGDTWTIEQRIVNLYAELNNRYTKAQTYSNAEIEQRITDLLGLANLQDVLIGTYTNGQTVLASDLSAYNFVIALGKDVNNTYTATFKPSEIVSGNVISLSSTVYLTRGATNFTITTPTSIKLWGIKLDGINATEVDYDNSTSGLVADKVQGAIDEVVVELNTLENKVDLTNLKQDIRINEIEELARKSASGETSDNVLGTDIIPLNKNTANAPMNIQVDGGILEAQNLVVNGDFTLDSNSDGIPDGFVVLNATANSLVDGIFTFTPTAQFGRIRVNISLTANDSIYYYASVKTTRTSVYLIGVNNNSAFNVYHSGNDEFQLLSNIQIASGSFNLIQLGDNQTSGFLPISVDYIGAYNVSTMKLKGIKSDNGTPFTLLTNEQIKTQLDLWISKGIIPNDNLLAVDMNKRVRSVSSDTLTTSDLYLQANVKGYSLPNGVKDTLEYRNGKYYFVKRVDDTDLNNLVELSPYVETEIEAWGNLQGYESGVVYVDDIKIDASIYNSGITTISEIKTLDEIVKITNGVETQIDTSIAVIAVDKLSFTHPDLVDGDYVWFAYEENGDYYKATTNITYYIDKLVRTSPDGSVWKLDWSVDNSGVITWTPTKI